MLHAAHASQFKSIKQEEHDCSSNTGHKSAQADSREEALQGFAHPRSLSGMNQAMEPGQGWKTTFFHQYQIEEMRN